MAIRRCPYCKAIIDEQDKYCNNCGTQLLFPEDEYVEEKIPGDKIVEEPEEEKRVTGELDEKEEPEEPEPAEEEEEKLEEDEEEEEEEDDEDEEEAEEQGEVEQEEGEGEQDEDTDDLEEPVEEKEEDKDETEEEPEEEFEVEAEGEELEEEEEEVEEIESPTAEIKTAELAGKPVQVDEPHKKYKVSIEEDELVFKTKELEGLTDTVEEGKEKAKAVTSQKVLALLQEREVAVPPTGELLPPWAKGIKEEPPASADLGRSKDTATETEVEPGRTPTRPEWVTDSGIGIPEKVTQAGLPFGTAAVPATAEAIEAEEEEEEEESGAETRQRARFSLRLRSKLVDVVFITALWVISLWFTAQVIGVSFFRLIVGTPLPVLAFYFILLLLYFFLFLYFLGETLGDHYFSGED